MPPFHQRPLSWLFWIAAGCVDVIALASNREAPWVDAVMLGQIIVVGGWLALGRSHRLSRAAIFVAAVCALTLPDFVADRRRGAAFANFDWPYVLGSVTAIAVATAVMVGVWTALGRKLFGAASPPEKSQWQIPVVEIFGWMNVVAVAAIGVNRADFAHLAERPRDLIVGLAFLTMTSAVVALTLGDFRKATWPKGMVESAWLVLLACAALAIPAGVPGQADESGQAIGACLLVGAWVLTQKLDNEHAGKRLQHELRVV